MDGTGSAGVRKGGQQVGFDAIDRDCEPAEGEKPHERDLHAESASEYVTPLLGEAAIMQEQRGDGVSVERITVLLADGHRIIRKGLRALLEAELDMEVVGEAENGRKAVKLAVALHPDVVVIDIAMPLLNGLEATRQILQTLPASKLLILSAHSDDAYVEEAIVSGVAGYLLIHASSGDLAKAIREIQNGKPFFSPSIAKRLHKQAVPSRFRQILTSAMQET